MFDSITYKNSIGPGPLIDIGALAEGLIFYGRVAIIGNSGTVKDILSRIPPFIFLSLLREGRIEFYYLAEQIGVSTTQTKDGRNLHNLIQFSSPDHTIEKIGPQEFKLAAGNTGQARVGASQFTKLLRPFSHEGFNQQTILNALTDDISITLSVESLIKTVTPNYGFNHELIFRIERVNEGFYVDNNIDFANINEHYHQLVSPKHSSITEAYILALLQQAYETTYFASSLNTEIAVHPIEKAIQEKSLEAVVRRHMHNEILIESFIDLTFSNGYAIREAVNSGAVSFADIVKLLDSADKFRHWLRAQPADENLIRAYYQEIIKNTWVEKLPGKSMRWSIFTGAGLGIDALGAGGLGTAAGIALSAVDSFILDKLVGGWKPHQFVEGELKAVFDDSRSNR
jgi:hypothetical protein